MSLLDEAARFGARPLIGPQYCIEIGMRNGRVAIHYRLHRSPDRWEIAPFFQKSADGNFIRGIQHRWQSSASVPRSAGQV
jgi:hypothetical protein